MGYVDKSRHLCIRQKSRAQQIKRRIERIARIHANIYLPIYFNDGVASDFGTIRS